jgi:Flp pilus assembly protein TadG
MYRSKPAIKLPLGRRINGALTSLPIRSNVFARFRDDESGSYLIISAIMMPVLIGSAGLATDYGLWIHTRQKMQNAADAAAYSAALAAVNGGGSITTQANAITSSSGFVNGSNGVVVNVNKPPASGSYTSTASAIEVVIQQPQTRFFSALMDSQSLVVRVRAVAIPGTNSGTGCVVALNKSASGAVSTQGTADIALTGCALYDDSSSASALSVGGSSTVTAQDVNVVGGISGTVSVSGSVNRGISAIADPYADVPKGSFSGCDHSNMSAKNTVTLNPGVYCNGLSLNAGANVTLSPGTYYFDQGNLSVNGGATLTGTGVTLVFTSSTGSNYATATINGGATVSVSAPTTGSMAGIVAYGDRNMSTGTTFKFNGGSAQIFTGALDLPNAAVQFAGGSNTSKACTQLVADTVTFTGNSQFAINCTGTGTKPIGTAITALVE